jgi:hypothetical protein
MIMDLLKIAARVASQTTRTAIFGLSDKEKGAKRKELLKSGKIKLDAFTEELEKVLDKAFKGHGDGYTWVGDGFMEKAYQKYQEDPQGVWDMLGAIAENATFGKVDSVLRASIALNKYVGSRMPDQLGNEALKLEGGPYGDRDKGKKEYHRLLKEELSGLVTT